MRGPSRVLRMQGTRAFISLLFAGKLLRREFQSALRGVCSREGLTLAGVGSMSRIVVAPLYKDLYGDKDYLKK